MTNNWWAYVEANTHGETQKEMAAESGIDQTVLSRWKLAKNPPSPEKVIAFARGVNRSPIEALIAAGYLLDSDATTTVRVERRVADLTADELLEEVRRRMTYPAPNRYPSENLYPGASHDHDTKPASDADRPPASGTPRETREGKKTARVVHIKRDGLNEQQSSPETEPEELPEDAWAARKRDPRFKPDIPSADDIGEENQDDE